MKKFSILAGVAVVGVVVAQSVTGPLGAYAKTLAGAQSLSATFTYQQIGGNSSAFKVDLAKPNLARIDRANELILADGKTITVFDKKQNTYFKVAQTNEELSKYFSEDEMHLFVPFFNPVFFDKFKVSDGGTKNRKGVAMNVVEAQIDQRGVKKATYYIDPTSKLARQVEFAYSDTGQVVRMLVDTKEYTLSNEIDAALFAFKAPDGSRELSAEEMASDKWYYDLEQAKAAAKKSGRKIFVDFFATWCGPCKKLAAEVFPTAEFKKLSKYFVFLQIDVDAQKDVAQTYNIEAMPTQMVLSADGAVVGKRVGYSNPGDFFNFINGYAN